MSDVIPKWRMKTKRNLRNQFVSNSINHCHVLILQCNISIIRTDCNSRVANKNPAVNRIVLYSIRSITWVKLHLGNNVKRAMLIRNIDNAIPRITDKDFAKIRSYHDTGSLRHIDQPYYLV